MSSKGDEFDLRQSASILRREALNLRDERDPDKLRDIATWVRNQADQIEWTADSLQQSVENDRRELVQADT